MKHFFCAVLLSLFASLTWAQVEFAPVGAEWYYRHNSGYSFTNSSGFSYAQYIGDTLLNGRVCKKICTTDFTYPVTSVQCNDYSNISFIYQNADSIFKYESYPSGNFRLQFRTNFQLGDTFQTDFGRQWVVTEVTELGFNNTIVHRFQMEDNTGNSTFVYDIFGPETGVLGHFPGELADGSTLDLRCYSDANFPQINLTGEGCDAILSAPEPNFMLIIAPNPAHDIINFEFRGTLSEPPSIKLWNASGRVILENFFDDGQQRLNVRNLPAGFYAITAEVDGKIIQQKLIKY